MDFGKLSFPEAPLIKVIPPGPKSREFLDFQSQHESSAVSYPRGLPMALSRAKGATVEDVDGNVYIDFFGGAGVMNVGHANPEVLAAAIDQVSELTHCLDVPNPARKNLAEILLSLLPSSLRKLFFGGPTGSDAVEAAVKLAKFNRKRPSMIAFEGSYHGMTAGALSLSSGLGFKEEFLPLVPEVHFVPYAYCYRCAFGRTEASCGLECAEYLGHVLENPHSGVGRPSAVIVEAIQGEGGTIVPPDAFLPRVREICDQHDVLLIVDEIQAGFCRTGRMFSFEHTGVVPDIITMSKALGGVGFPISGVAFKEELDTWSPGKHIGTFRGNVVAYAAGHAALKFMVENKLAEHASELGSKMLTLLKPLEKDSDVVGEVRGKGLMLGIELVHDRAAKAPAPDLARKLRTLCLPPLIMTEDLARRGLEIFIDSLENIERSR